MWGAFEILWAKMAPKYQKQEHLQKILEHEHELISKTLRKILTNISRAESSKFSNKC